MFLFHQLYFDKWLTLFDEGYSILLNGLGSKRNLMQSFHSKKLENQHVLVVNGFFPSLTVKDILENVAKDFLEMTNTSSNLHDVVDMIAAEMKKYPGLRIFLMIHNLDGGMLRNEKAQHVLSRLSAIERIHLIATIDHVNAPLSEYLFF